jgi:hypothetical protein
MMLSPNLPAVLFSTAVALQATPAVDTEQRIEALLSRMTLDERIGQMSQSTSMKTPISAEIKDEIRKGRWGSFLNTKSPADRAEAQRIAVKESRLGIPLIGRDVIHGYRTIFPIPGNKRRRSSWRTGCCVPSSTLWLTTSRSRTSRADIFSITPGTADFLVRRRPRM